MPNVVEIKASVDLVKQSYLKTVSLGEAALACDFKMAIDGYDDLGFLIQATQLPEAKREVVEVFGPHGVKVQQQGRTMNSGDITFTAKEVIKGLAYRDFRQIVKDKVYVDITIGMPSESLPEGNQFNTVRLEDCWIEVDATDLGVEDSTTGVKPAGTIHYNWVSWFEEPSESLGWEG